MADVDVEIDGMNKFGFNASQFTDKELKKDNEINYIAFADLFSKLKEQVNEERKKYTTCYYEVEQQISVLYIKKEEVKELIANAIEHPRNIEFYSKEKFRLVDFDTLKDFLSGNDVRNRNYITDSSSGSNYDYSCRAFNRDLYSAIKSWDADLCFAAISGDVSAGYHAINLFIDTNKNVYYLEPQYNRIDKMEDSPLENLKTIYM